MRDHTGYDYGSVADSDGSPSLIPEKARRLAGAAVFVGLVATLGIWSYRLGTRDATEVPIIKAMAPARVEPAEPGGLQAAHQGLELSGVLAGKPTVVAASTPAARPAPKALATEDAPQGELVAAAPAALAEQVRQRGDAPLTDEEEQDVLGENGSDVIASPDDGAPPDADDTTEMAALTPALAGPRPMNRPAGLKVVRPAKTTPVASKPATPAAATLVSASVPAAATARPTAAKEVTSVKSGTRLVQLGAFDSDALTRQAWAQLVAHNSDLLASKSLYVERTTANARVFYRLRVAGFQTADQTRQMCESLRARGIDCIPVTLQ